MFPNGFIEIILPLGIPVNIIFFGNQQSALTTAGTVVIYRYEYKLCITNNLNNLDTKISSMVYYIAIAKLACLINASLSR